MSKFYEEYIEVKEGKKITDKVLYTRITVSVVSILVCLAMMAFAASAFFTEGITSANNVIQSATLEPEISILNETITISYETAEAPAETEESSPEPRTISPQVEVKTITRTSVDVRKASNGVYFAMLGAGKNNITIRLSGNVDTAFCIFEIDGVDKVFHTQQIGVDVNAPNRYTEAITVSINTDASVLLYITPHWV